MDKDGALMDELSYDTPDGNSRDPLSKESENVNDSFAIQCVVL